MSTNQGLGQTRSLASFCFGLFHICLVIPIKKYERSWSAIRISIDASSNELAKSPVLMPSTKQCLLVDFQLNLKQPFYWNTKVSYGTEQLLYEYDFLKSAENTPVILIPKRYIYIYIYIYIRYSPNTGISTVFLCSALRRALLFPWSWTLLEVKWRELGDLTQPKLIVSKFIEKEIHN